jgi:NAD(P)-dependent dehydrogenase (short-subunit alcohol dehydrogenase family)
MAASGRRIIVSGGTSGIGAAVAARLVQEGASVWILGRREETVRQSLADLAGLAGGTACDVSDGAAVDTAFGEALGQLGGLDGAFVNAGIDGAGIGVLELEAETFRRVLDVNVVGAFSTARAAARAMGPGSAIVINASVNALRPEPQFADYNASKAAVVSLAKTMALELGPRGIAVSSICPGYIPTPMTQPYIDDEATARELLAEIPAGRFGTAEEVAALVAFLLSPDAGYMGGAVVSVDGGRSV